MKRMMDGARSVCTWSPAKRKEKRKKQEKSVSITKPQSHDNQKPLEHHHGRSMYKSEEKMICFHVPCRTW